MNMSSISAWCGGRTQATGRPPHMLTRTCGSACICIYTGYTTFARPREPYTLKEQPAGLLERLHGVGAHASGFYAMLVLISGIDAQWPPLADAVPN